MSGRNGGEGRRSISLVECWPQSCRAILVKRKLEKETAERGRGSVAAWQGTKTEPNQSTTRPDGEREPEAGSKGTRSRKQPTKKAKVKSTGGDRQSIAYSL